MIAFCREWSIWIQCAGRPPRKGDVGGVAEGVELLPIRPSVASNVLELHAVVLWIGLDTDRRIKALNSESRNS